MAERRDELAEHRTGLAHERTRVALARTLLAWWRTTLGLYGVGLAVARLLPEGPGTLDAWLGEAFVVAGMMTLVVGYRDVARAYERALRTPPETAMVALTAVLLLLGIGAMIVALAV